MDSKKFRKVLTKYEHPAIILYIDAEGSLKLETSADLDLAQEMLDHAAEFLQSTSEVEVSDGDTEFVNNKLFH